MAKSNVKEQIKEIESAVEDFQEYIDLLNIRKAILEILIPLDGSPTKGARNAVGDEALKNLEEKALASKRPIISFLDPSIFDEDMVSSVSSKVTECILRGYPGGKSLQSFLTASEKGIVDTRGALDAIMNEDAGWFQRIAKKFGIEPSLLLLIFQTPLQPFFEDLARRVEGKLIETWWEPFCPVCGRTSNVARIRGRKRYMTCVYCGAEYLIDLFLCVNCGNNEPYSLGFITFDEHPEYELNYCEKCNHYVKTVYEDRLRRIIPKGLEDLITRKLDQLAEEQELSLSRT